MKLSDYVIDFLAHQGLTHVFEVCGGALTHLLDSMYDRKDIVTVSMHHEQAAAFAAEGYSRISGNIGVAMATSGPGATNLITGIGSCFFDSVPCLFITGQVNTYEFKFDRPIRQMGFQETDIVSIVKPIVKEAVLITDSNKIRYLLERLLYIARSGRPGPVLIDIPMNIQRADINPETLESFSASSLEQSTAGVSDELIRQVIEVIKSSLRPVVLIGGGIRLSKAQANLLKFINKTGIPVVSSLMGLDAFPHSEGSFVGMIGSYGNRYANLTIANSDLILALGTRLDVRQVGTKPETFARDAKIIHVDIDPNELNDKVKTDFPVNCDVGEFLSLLNSRIDAYDKQPIKDWWLTIKGYKEKYPTIKKSTSDDICPNHFMQEISEFFPDDSIICVDVGQNQMWAAQSIKIKKGQRLLTQGGMGSMGSALSMAIGASFANQDKTVVVVTGDGGFQLNIQELQTVYHHKLPIKIVLLNNCCYGMVKQFQKQYFNSKFQSTLKGYSCPNFEDVVSAYKIPVTKIKHKAEICDVSKKFFAKGQAAFIEVSLSIDSQVFPKLSVNRPIEDQDPLLSREELKSSMLIDILPEPKEL